LANIVQTMDSVRDTSSTELPAMELRVVPANEASWPDLQAIFGTTGDPGHCYCQWFKIRQRDWSATSVEERRDRLRDQTRCGHPGAGATSGLVAYLGSEPVGWVAVEPRTGYPRLSFTRNVWAGRAENKADGTVWAVTCFVTRRGYRKKGISYALAAATVDFARQRGARALEAYPITTSSGEAAPPGLLYVGTRQVFVAAGFAEVSRPAPGRVVMRIDFG
jgi:GNAT superfamily N-acetyltransferase